MANGGPRGARHRNRRAARPAGHAGRGGQSGGAQPCWMSGSGPAVLPGAPPAAAPGATRRVCRATHLGAALERALLSLEAGPEGTTLAQDARAQLDASLEAAVALLRRREPRGAPAGELRGAVEAYSVLRGEVVVQLRDAELVVPGYGTLRAPEAFLLAQEEDRQT